MNGPLKAERIPRFTSVVPSARRAGVIDPIGDHRRSGIGQPPILCHLSDAASPALRVRTASASRQVGNLWRERVSAFVPDPTLKGS